MNISNNSEDTTIQGPTATTGIFSSTGSKTPYLTILQGGWISKVHTMMANAPTLIGRAGDAEVRIKDQSVSRKHARIKMHPEGSVMLEDLDSRNGTFVNGVRVEKRLLEEGDSIRIGTSCIIRFSHLDDEQRRVEESSRSLKDPETEIYSKKFLLDRIEAEFAYAQRHNGLLGLLVFEIDQFTDITNTYGQPGGGLILRELALVVSQILRTQDMFVHYGMWFAVLAHDLCDADAVALAQRIHRAVNEHRFVLGGERIAVTVSIGIGTLSDTVKEAEQLIEVAQKSLSKTKNKGT